MKKTILDYFESTVNKFPDNIAVSDINNSLTYNELMNKSKILATEIVKYNISDKPIVLLMKRTTNLPIAMMSVLYSGNFYVVLDCESPLQRIDKIITTLSPAMIIYENDLASILSELNLQIHKLDFEDAFRNIVIDEQSLENIRNKMTSSNTAYSIFTSGSTGVPKGAILTHLNVISYIHWFIKCFDINENTSFGSQTPLYFSMSVSDFYASIFTGASYNMIPKEYFAFPAKLISFMNDKKIDTIYWVPSALGIVAKFDLLKYCMPEYLKKVFFAGEVMPVKYLNYWKKYLPNILYANLFGPTETTDICSYYIVNRDFDETQNIPIGVACDNCELLVVDENGKEVLDDSIGELLVKGPFVASGYYANKEKTSEVFVQNPLHDNYIDIVYKTGDLVKKNKYGEFDYIGRKDFQIKHLGYRIEPSEIEVVLNTVDKVDLSVCIYDKVNDKLILAYEAKNDINKELKQASEKLLPHYMQPSEFIKFDIFPKNANGKIDRKQISKVILEDKGE